MEKTLNLILQKLESLEIEIKDFRTETNSKFDRLENSINKSDMESLGSDEILLNEVRHGFSKLNQYVNENELLVQRVNDLESDVKLIKKLLAH